MPLSNPSLADDPVGPVKATRELVIGSEDVEIDAGFICTVLAPATGGVLVYRELNGDADRRRAGLAANTTITTQSTNFPLPVLVRTIRGSSTVTRVEAALT